MLEARVGRADSTRRAFLYAVVITASIAGAFAPARAAEPSIEIAAVAADEAGVVSFETVPATEIGDAVVEYREIEAPAEWASVLSPQVVGGDEVDISRHRYGVKLFVYDGPFLATECGGVLVTPEWVLTAAHCVELRRALDLWVPPDELHVVYGVSDWTDFVHDRDSSLTSAEAYVLHPDWDRSVLANDIALVRLTEPVDLSRADTIPLYDLDPLVEGDVGYVTGWGATQTNGFSVEQLQGLEVSVAADCGVWPEVLPEWDDTRVCAAATTPDAGICQGDSGGPMVVSRHGLLMVAGLVSFNSTRGCGSSAEVPDVYTRVSSHVDWIESVTGPLWSVGTLNEDGTATLPDARPGRTYAIRIGDGSTGASAIETVTMPGAFLRGPTETGVDCSDGGSSPFVDVAPTSFAADAVACLHDLGVTTGTSATTFDPTAAVTREQMAALVARLRGVVTGERCQGGHDFVDVEPTSYAADAIGCLASTGITRGTSPTTFGPAEIVRRDQAAAFLARLYEELTGESCAGPVPFSDLADDSFAHAAVGCLVTLGVTTGTSPTNFSPEEPVTREQAAALLARLYSSLAA